MFSMGKVQFATVCLVLLASLGSCSGSEKKSPAPSTPSDAATPTPVTTPTADGSLKPEDTAKEQCWNKLLNASAVSSCAGIYSFSGKACAPSLTKEATCTRESVAAQYGSATLNGQPAMTVVDQWISDGYEPNQCARGTDSKLYVYFVKKTFTAKSASANGQDQYNFADKRLGPAGAILNGITLGTVSETSFTCE